MTWNSTMSSGYSSLEEDSEEFFFTARTSFFKKPPAKAKGERDVEKQQEPQKILTKDELRQKIEDYNSSVTDRLKMNLSPNEVYTGFIKVQMDLRRPITIRATSIPGRRAYNTSNETAFYLPKDTVNTLHISSCHTVKDVIEALLKKFTVLDNPAKFALFKQMHVTEQVHMSKLSDGQHPLYLRLLAGPSPDALSFVLRECETGEVLVTPSTLSLSIPSLPSPIDFSLQLSLSNCVPLFPNHKRPEESFVLVSSRRAATRAGAWTLDSR